MNYEKLYGSSPVVLLLADEHLGIVHASRAAAALFGYSAERTLYELFERESVAALSALMHTLRMGDAPVSSMARAILHDGSSAALPCMVDKIDRGGAEGIAGNALLRIT